MSPGGPELVERRYREVLASAMGVDAAVFGSQGTHLAPDGDRAGWSIASVYWVGDAAVVWCDPAVADRVRSLAGPGTVNIDDLDGWASANGGEYLGGGWNHLPGQAPITSATPAGITLRSLEAEAPDDVALVRSLVESSDPDDVEAAEVDLEDLDPVQVGAVTEEGTLAGWAGSRPWETDEGFGDVGVLVGPDVRRSGVGAALVAAVCEELLREGSVPLYRASFDRVASRGLALSLGFREVTVIGAIRFE